MNILLEAFTPSPTDNMADTLSSHPANDGLPICRKFVGIKVPDSADCCGNMFVFSCRPLRLFSTRPTLIAPSRKLFDIVHRLWNFSKNWTPCSESLWHCTTHFVWKVVSGIVVSSHCFHMGVTNFAPHHAVCFHPQISSQFHLVHF